MSMPQSGSSTSFVPGVIMVGGQAAPLTWGATIIRIMTASFFLPFSRPWYALGGGQRCRRRAEAENFEMLPMFGLDCLYFEVLPIFGLDCLLKIILVLCPLWSRFHGGHPSLKNIQLREASSHQKTKTTKMGGNLTYCSFSRHIFAFSLLFETELSVWSIR